MKILVTGNMGYVGSELIKYLAKSFDNLELVGFDAGYFAHCLTGCSRVPEVFLARQHFGDVRLIDRNIFDGVDAVVHLAAISNDPMGSKYETVTADINYKASVNIAKLAIDSGVKSFIFASSCSMYGYAEGGARKESDDLNPLTAYARSKVYTEQLLSKINLPDGASITCLRFATACGMSDRLRLDLVLNDFVACAYSAKSISILSDGTPWRPLIAVSDMLRAIEWAICRDSSKSDKFLAVNVGSEKWTYQVKDLAEAVARIVPGTKININTQAASDARSYKVDFSLFQSIAPNFQPKETLDETIMGLLAGLERMKFEDINFRNSTLMRLRVLESHANQSNLNENLQWRRGKL